MLKLVLLLTVFGCTLAKIWNNPVLDGQDLPDPGVIKVNGVYYAATTTNNNKYEKFPIHASKDLQNWELVGYIFNETNFPPYNNIQSSFWAPELHQIGENEFRAYYTSRHNNGLNTIGAASAKNVLGPYKPIEEPLLMDDGVEFIDPTLVQDNGNLILVWTSVGGVYMRNLTSDGLRFRDEDTYIIFNHTLPWEGATTEGAWYVGRNGWHYIFYSGNFFCGPEYSVGVVRSKGSIIGPYEKKEKPILVANDRFKGPGHGSILRDIDDKGWVFVYHGWHAGQICDPYPRVLFTSSLEWGDDDWPLDVVISN